MAAMAGWGELQRVPVELYRKRYHSGNEHSRWFTWPTEKITQAWTFHCADMLEQAMLVQATTQEHRLLWMVAVGRLLATRFGFLPPANLTPAECMSLLNGFFEQIQTTGHMDIPRLLEENWSNIVAWTKRIYAPAAKPGSSAQP
jgi:hypothetical protein